VTIITHRPRERRRSCTTCQLTAGQRWFPSLQSPAAPSTETTSHVQGSTMHILHPCHTFQHCPIMSQWLPEQWTVWSWQRCWVERLWAQRSVILWETDLKQCSAVDLLSQCYSHTWYGSCTPCHHTQPPVSKYQLLPINACDRIVMLTQLYNHCKKLVADHCRHCQLSWYATVQFTTHWASTFVELSW